MKYIKLTRGKVAIVDDEDYEILSKRKWCCILQGYATARINNKVVCMHRLIMNAPKNKLVDHINMNKLDNRKSNLRLVNRIQSEANKKCQVNSKTGFKGVYFRNEKGRVKKYLAKLWYKRGEIHLGYFLTAEEAAIFYDRKAKEIHGEYARLNIPM